MPWDILYLIDSKELIEHPICTFVDIDFHSSIHQSNRVMKKKLQARLLSQLITGGPLPTMFFETLEKQQCKQKTV